MKFEITSADDRHFYLHEFYEYRHQNDPLVASLKSRTLETDFRDSSATHTKY